MVTLIAIISMAIMICLVNLHYLVHVCRSVIHRQVYLTLAAVGLSWITLYQSTVFEILK